MIFTWGVILQTQRFSRRRIFFKKAHSCIFLNTLSGRMLKHFFLLLFLRRIQTFQNIPTIITVEYLAYTFMPILHLFIHA